MMSDFERWQEVKAIVQAALDLPDEERTSYLDAVWGNDADLRREVEALLAVSSTRADFFDNYQALPPGLRRPELAEGEIVGHYRIIRPLGEGGMGAVYLAQDSEVSRKVALKILPHRLTQEQEFLARLQHPNIAVFFDSGTTRDGFGYFAMEYIEGEPITLYCEQKSLSIKERLGLFLQVCDAVSFAHRNLVVHRDIKPSNILIDSDGRPKLLDFGIAKLLPADKELLTRTRPEERSLTLAFASPEQLEGERTTTATDIYSLGVLLCLLLTGRLPYAVKSYHDLPWAIRNMEPEKPSHLVVKELPSADSGTELLLSRPSTNGDSRKLARKLSGDLDAIALKALRKEPEKRYQTIAELAEDVRRHLGDEPVSAIKGSTRYKAGKFVRRHAFGITIAVVFSLAVILLLCGLLYQWRQAVVQRDIATRNEEQAETTTQFLVDLFDRSSSWPATGVTQTPEQFIDGATNRLSHDLITHPQLRARLLNTLAEIYIRLGSYAKAESLLKTAFSIQRQALGSQHPDVSETLNAFGALRLAQGQFNESESLFLQSLAIVRHYAKEKPAPVANRLSNLSALKRYQGKFVEAERYAREALTICDAHPEAARKHLDNVLRHLSRALEKQDRYDEAETITQRVIQLRTQELGPSHPSTALALADFALILHDKGDHVGEERYYRKALRILEATLPPDSPDRVNMSANLAGALTHLDRLTEAEILHRQALDTYRKVLNENHPLIGTAINNIAHVLLQEGRFEEAADLFRKALPVMQAAHGPQSQEVSIVLNNLAVTLTRLEHYEEADKIFRQAVIVSRRAFGEKTVDTALTLKDYGNLKLKQGRFAEAKLLLEESLDILQTKLPKGHVDTAHAQVLLGASLAGLGKFQESERLEIEGYSFLSRKEAGKQRKTHEALDHLVELYSRWGKPDKAAHYRKLLADSGKKSATP